MAATSPKVTDAELAILKLLWDRDALTAREIREALYPEGTPSDHATVQKLLQRLEAKGAVARDRSAFAHVFRASLSREALAGQQLEFLADKLTDGSLVPFIMHAVGSRKLSLQELDDIRSLFERKK